MNNSFKIGGYFTVECFDKNGNFKWKDTSKNTVTNVGLNHILDVILHGTSQISTWYVGLTDGTPTVSVNDTIGSHAGWVEIEDYDEGDRQAYNEAAASSQSITNSANKATFTITDSVTLGGAFLVSENTPGGSSGTLLCAAAFSGGNKAVVLDDVVYVTYTIGASNS